MKQTNFVVGALIVIASLAWLAWVGAKESKTYYHTIAELSTTEGWQGAPSHARGRYRSCRLDRAIQRAGGRGRC